MNVIRPYQPSDRDDVYRICIMTGDNGGDATGSHANDEVIPDVYAGPYLEFDPGLAFVVDTGSHVAGYVIATADTRRFVERYREDWLPMFQEKYPRGASRGDTDRLIDAGYHPERMLGSDIDEYPAHLHIDLLPELQGQGYGRKLIRTLLPAVRQHGAEKLHLGVSPTNYSARAFYQRIGFVETPSSTPEGPILGIATDAVV